MKINSFIFKSSLLAIGNLYDRIFYTHSATDNYLSYGKNEGNLKTAFINRFSRLPLSPMHLCYIIMTDHMCYQTDAPGYYISIHHTVARVISKFIYDWYHISGTCCVDSHICGLDNRLHYNVCLDSNMA